MAEIVNKRKFDQNSLTLHNEISQKCEICQKVFRTKQQLKRHITAVHLIDNEKEYYCNICTKAYSNQSKLTFHVDTVHGGHKNNV